MVDYYYPVPNRAEPLLRGKKPNSSEVPNLAGQSREQSDGLFASSSELRDQIKALPKSLAQKLAEQKDRIVDGMRLAQKLAAQKARIVDGMRLQGNRRDRTPRDEMVVPLRPIPDREIDYSYTENEKEKKKGMWIVAKLVNGEWVPIEEYMQMLILKRKEEAVKNAEKILETMRRMLANVKYTNPITNKSHAKAYIKAIAAQSQKVRKLKLALQRMQNS